MFFYSEKEMLRLEKQARNGWMFSKLNRWSFLEFYQVPPQERTFAVDFYTGAKNEKEINEYISMYEASGWTYVSDFRKKYFYFSSKDDIPPIFTDQASFEEKIRAETKWSLRNGGIIGALGLLMTCALFSLIKLNYLPREFFPGLFFGISIGTMLFPLFQRIIITFLNDRYKDRSSFFSHPERFAKKQTFWRDLVMITLLGAVIGACFGFFVGWMM